MNTEQGQPGLWAQTERDEIKETLERTRDVWCQVRIREGINSPKEKRAWKAYRDASDRYWKVLRP